MNSDTQQPESTERSGQAPFAGADGFGASAGYASPDEWRAEARRRFGDDPMNWKFVCPSCGHIATVADWKAVGATEGEVAFSCVGRHIKGSKQMCERPGPCNYAGGGLIGLNPVTITTAPGKTTSVFAFA